MIETATGAGGAEYPPKHFSGAAGTTNENDMHTRREYDKVALEALARGKASAGPAAGEDSHGATTHRAGRPEDEGEEGKPQEGKRGASGNRRRRDGGEGTPQPVARA